MPPHSHVLTYIMEVTGSAQSPGQVGGVRRVSQRRVSGQLKPYPSPEGLVGLYFRAYHQDGTLLLDGMLPNPLEIRLFPPQAGAAPTPPIDRPLQHELPAPFSLRLPDVPGLHRVDFYWVPPSAPFAASRDKSEWLIGSVPVP